MLGLVVVVQGRSLRRPGFMLAGLGAPALITVAIGLGVAYDSGLTYGLAEYLDRGSSPTPARPLPPGAPPRAADRLPLGHSRLLPRRAPGGGDGSARIPGSAGIVAAGRPRNWSGGRTLWKPPGGPNRSWLSATRTTRARLARIGSGRCWPPRTWCWRWLTLAAAGLVGNRLAGALAPALRLGGESLARPVIFVTDLGALLIGLFATVLAVMGLVAYRSPGAIRLVGARPATFWPRAAHPARPARLRRAGGPGARPAGSGSSPPTGTRCCCPGRVTAACSRRSLTFNCPTHRPRVALADLRRPARQPVSANFPAYVSDEMLREVGNRLAWRWINVWRYTDAVGGAVFVLDVHELHDPAARVDRRVLDPEGGGDSLTSTRPRRCRATGSLRTTTSTPRSASWLKCRNGLPSELSTQRVSCQSVQESTGRKPSCSLIATM